MDPPPQVDHLPTDDGGRELYKAAGRSIAVLYAMEGADSFIAYLPEEEQDAQDTKKLVEEKGAKCYTFATDLKSRDNCKETVEKAVKQMGGIDILVNNHAYQMMVNDISDLTE
jgi:NAD(P)-dependent dehydrogenase (short-subunit alcohol dehydrogenase family)